MMHKIYWLSLCILRCGAFIARDTEPRLNWGIIFRRGANVLNGYSKYRHTFSIPIPRFTFNRLNPVSCEHNEILEIHCNSINEMIRDYNLNTEPKVQEFNTHLALLIESIPNIDDGKRKKRDTNLGADFCDQIKNPNYTAEKKGFLASFGRAMSGLFGQPTYDDIKIIDKHICLVSEQIELEAEEIQRTTDTLESFSIAVDNRINAIQEGQVFLYHDIKHTNDQLIKLSLSVQNATTHLEKRLNLAIASNALVMKIEQAMQMNRDILSSMRTALERFQSSINILMSGRLPSTLISYNTLDKILLHVGNEILKYNMKIVNKNPMFYYLQENIVFTRSMNKIYIMVNIPVYALGGLLQVYRIDVHNLPVNENTPGGSKIVGLPDFIAVTEDANYYVEMSAADLSSCIGEKILTCSSEKSLRSFTALTCAAALFKESNVDIDNLCDFRYDSNPSVSFATKITNNTYLVHAQKFGPQYRWSVDCSYIGERKKKTIDSCQNCVVTLGCGCSLTAQNEFLIPAQLNDCPFSFKSTSSYLEGYEPVQISYPINLATARVLFEDSALERIKQIGANDLSPKWDFSMPDLHVQEYNWNQTVEKSQKYSMELRKLVQASKESTQIFATKSDIILAEATNFSDLALSQIDELTRAFKPWEFLASLDPSTSVGLMTLLYILTTTSIIMSCYVLCTRK